MMGVLTIMFSTTGSLAAYRRNGTYSYFLRRLSLYADHFETVHVCTSDGRNDTETWNLPNAIHHPMPERWASNTGYHLLAPLLHGRALRDTTVVRTFNITGALPGIVLRAYTGAPVFVSYGYSLPDFIRFERGRFKSGLYRIVERIALSGSDCILAATPAQVRRLSDRFSDRRIAWLPNAVDTDLFCLKSTPRSDHLLFVGRLTPQKNLDAFFRAVARVDPSLPIRIVGEGEAEPQLRRLAADLGLRVAFMGTVSNDRLAPLYAEARAFVLPSHFEGMPKVLLEAMACGVACLGSDVDGIRDVIEDEKTGILAPPSVDGLARGIDRLADPDLREALGRAARRFVVEHFSLEKVMAREIRLLQGGS